MYIAYLCMWLLQGTFILLCVMYFQSGQLRFASNFLSDSVSYWDKIAFRIRTHWHFIILFKNLTELNLRKYCRIFQFKTIFRLEDNHVHILKSSTSTVHCTPSDNYRITNDCVQHVKYKFLIISNINNCNFVVLTFLWLRI